MNLDGFALPVKLKGTDPVETLDLSDKSLGVASAVVIASLIGVNGVLTECNVRGNNLDSESAKKLAMIGTEKGIMLFGIKRDQKEANFRKQILGLAAPADAILFSSDLVIGSLTSIDLSSNHLCGLNWKGDGQYSTVGITAIADALRVNGWLTSINLSGNDFTNYGTDITGIKQLAAALGVNSSLTECDLSNNNMSKEGEALIRKAVEGKAGFKLGLSCI